MLTIHLTPEARERLQKLRTTNVARKALEAAGERLRADAVEMHNACARMKNPAPNG